MRAPDQILLLHAKAIRNRHSENYFTEGNEVETDCCNLVSRQTTPALSDGVLRLRSLRFLLFNSTSASGLSRLLPVGLIVGTLIAFPPRIPAEETGSGPAISVPRELPRNPAHSLPEPNWIDQPQAEADRKSRGCLECHAGVEPMHVSKNVVLGCTDCHGGSATPGLTQFKAHVQPRNSVFWQSSANPNDSAVLLNHESCSITSPPSSFNSSIPATCASQTRRAGSVTARLYATSATA
jgi:hypothetical protein